MNTSATSAPSGAVITPPKGSASTTPESPSKHATDSACSAPSGGDSGSVGSGGGLSSLSVLTSLLDSAAVSVAGSAAPSLGNRKAEDQSGNAPAHSSGGMGGGGGGGHKHRDHAYGGASGGGGSRYARYDGFGSGGGRGEDGNRGPRGNGHGSTNGGRWKAPGGGGGGSYASSSSSSATGFPYSDYGRRHYVTAGTDSFNKNFAAQPGRSNVQASLLSSQNIFSRGRSGEDVQDTKLDPRNQSCARTTLSTPGVPTPSSQTETSLPTTPLKYRPVLSDRGATSSAHQRNLSFLGVSPSSCPTPASSGHSTPSVTASVPPAGTPVIAPPTTTGTASGEESAQSTEPIAAPAPVSAAPSRPSGGGAWRPSRFQDPRVKLIREAKGLLNKLTVENFPVVGEKMCNLCTKVESAEQLNELVDLVLDKAFSEPDFSELYADLCLIMSYSSPASFDSTPAAMNRPASGGLQQSLFSSLMIQKARNEFSKLPEKLELTPEQLQTLTPDDQEVELTKIKTRVRGLCVSFAEFLVRRMIGMRGFNMAAQCLLAAEQPGEHLLEGMCQMITTAGAYLDSDPVGKRLLENCFGRLQELEMKGYFSKRIIYLVQDLIDARKVQWHRRVHKEKAKGLSQIKQEAENADLVGGAVVRAQYGYVVQLGQRTNLLNNEEYARYMQKHEERYHARFKEQAASTSPSGTA